MRESIKHFVKICAESLPISDPVYEFGSLQVPGQEDFADLRPLFPSKKYVGADMRDGPGVDTILDLHDINLPSESVGTVLMLDTLEHVEFPRKAVEEIYRILKKDGTLIVSSVMDCPIHDHPSDYWRFTPEGLSSLLRPFNLIFSDFAGENIFPHTVVGIGLKGLVPEASMNEFREKFGEWKELWTPVSTARWKKVAKLTVSPLRLEIYRKVYTLSL